MEGLFIENALRHAFQASSEAKAVRILKAMTIEHPDVTTADIIQTAKTVYSKLFAKLADHNGDMKRLLEDIAFCLFEKDAYEPYASSGDEDDDDDDGEYESESSSDSAEEKEPCQKKRKEQDGFRTIISDLMRIFHRLNDQYKNILSNLLDNNARGANLSELRPHIAALKPALATMSEEDQTVLSRVLSLLNGE